MSPFELKKAIDAFKANAIQDEEDEILQKMKNEAYSLIGDARNVVSTSSVGYAEKENIQNIIHSLEDSISSDNKTKIKLGTAKLRSTLLKLLD